MANDAAKRAKLRASGGERLPGPATDVNFGEPIAEEYLSPHGRIVVPASTPSARELHIRPAVSVRTNHLLPPSLRVAALVRRPEPAVPVVAMVELPFRARLDHLATTGALDGAPRDYHREAAAHRPCARGRTAETGTAVLVPSGVSPGVGSRARRPLRRRCARAQALPAPVPVRVLCGCSGARRARRRKLRPMDKRRTSPEPMSRKPSVRRRCQDGRTWP